MAEQISDELLALLRETFSSGDVVETLARKQPNWIQRIDREGVYVETEKSRRERNDPQLVPSWMLERAWRHLNEHRTLSNSFLVSTEGLNVKRSAAVCAMLARLPAVVVVSDRPIQLAMRRT